MSDLPKYLKEQTFVAFDTETTGMWAPVNRVVEVAAVKFRPGEDQLGTFETLVNPERPIPRDVIEIHGITNDMVAAAPTIKPVLERFGEFCGEDSILIAHNAPFDISFLGCELNRVGLSFGDNPIIDTVDICHRFFPGLPSYSLLNLIRHFQLADSQKHRALSDAEYVRQLFEKATPLMTEASTREEFLQSLTVHSMADWKSETAELPADFGDLTAAIAESRRVEIDYNHPAKPTQLRVIRPKQVYRLGSVLYINSFCEYANAERTFRLDRIRSYRVLGPPD